MGGDQFTSMQFVIKLNLLISVTPGQQTTAPATLPPSQPTLPSCTNGKVFQTCGTACPRTCDNYQQEFLPCTRQCVADCFCPSGLVEMGDRCVSPSECPGKCSQDSTVKCMSRSI